MSDIQIRALLALGLLAVLLVVAVMAGQPRWLIAVIGLATGYWTRTALYAFGEGNE